MATQMEYAALAAHVYNDQRGGGNDSLTNRLDVPNGWVSLRQQGFAVGDSLNAINPFSFTGGAYQGNGVRSCLLPSRHGSTFSLG